MSLYEAGIYMSDYYDDDADEPTLECTNMDCEDEDGWPQKVDGPPAGFTKVRDQILAWDEKNHCPAEWSWIDEPYWECPKCRRQYGPEDWR
jgi:hypothetical protein